MEGFHTAGPRPGLWAEGGCIAYGSRWNDKSAAVLLQHSNVPVFLDMDAVPPSNPSTFDPEQNGLLLYVATIGQNAVCCLL